MQCVVKLHSLTAEPVEGDQQLLLVLAISVPVLVVMVGLLILVLLYRYTTY